MCHGGSEGHIVLTIGQNALLLNTLLQNSLISIYCEAQFIKNSRFDIINKTKNKKNKINGFLTKKLVDLFILFGIKNNSHVNIYNTEYI